MKPKSLPLAAALVAAIALLSSCASTPQSRIANNPQIYQSLSTSQQALVSQGRIKEGMASEAVYLAWGRPDYVKQASSGGSMNETWIYSGMQPDYYQSGGYAYGGYGGYGGYGYGYGRGCYGGGYYGPTVVYRSYVAGKVGFRRNRVTEWEITRP